MPTITSALTNQVAPKSSVKLTMLLASSSRKARPMKKSAGSKRRNARACPRLQAAYRDRAASSQTTHDRLQVDRGDGVILEVEERPVVGGALDAGLAA